MINLLLNTRDLVHAAAHELVGHLFPGAAVYDQPLTDACAIPGRPHAAQDGRLICDWHRQELNRMLRDIEDEAVRLSVFPSLAVSYDSGPGSGVPAFERAPLRLEARALIDRRHGTGVTRGRDFDDTGWDATPSVLETLHAWARIVRQERRLDVPTDTVMLGRAPGRKTPGPVCDRLCWHDSCGPWETDTVLAPATVSGERDLLTRHLDWIARQPWVDEMHTELKDLLTQLRRANNTLEVHVGTCDTLRPNGTLCDGKVWHVLIKPDGKIVRGGSTPGPDDEPGFQCGACRRVWTGTDAVRKRNDMWLDEQRKATKQPPASQTGDAS